jgi:hypothetical protein
VRESFVFCDYRHHTSLQGYSLYGLVEVGLVLFFVPKVLKVSQIFLSI